MRARDAISEPRTAMPSSHSSGIVVPTPKSGARHNALHDAEKTSILYFKLKKLENEGTKIKFGPNGFGSAMLIKTPNLARSSHPVQPFSRSRRVWYRDACDEIVAATIMDVLPPSAHHRYDIQTDAGERIDTNNIRQWSEVPPTVETWESTQATKLVTHSVRPDTGR